MTKLMNLCIVFFCLFSAQQMKHKPKKEHLPRPTLMHHTVEDFLTTWDGPVSHILPIRRFLENVFDMEMRNFYAEECMLMALTYTSLPYKCQPYLKGAGLSGNLFMHEMKS